MTLMQLIKRVRQHTRDTTGAIFQEIDITDFINEGIDRLKDIPELLPMMYLIDKNDPVHFLPQQYHYLLAVFATARCFGMDEREYKASTFMNEFEMKMEEMRNKIDSGDLVILDPNGNPIDNSNPSDAVVDVYFKRYKDDEEVVM